MRVCNTPPKGIISLIRANIWFFHPISRCGKTPRSWPDPNLNNRWPGVVPRYFPINPNSAATFGTRGAGLWDPTGAKPLQVPAKTRSAPKRGSAKRGLTRGYRLTFATTGLGWDDL